MKFTALLVSLIAILVLEITARNLPAQETMRVAIPLFPTAAFPLLVASDKGFFQREGLTVEPIRINSAPTTYQALISGDVHAASGAPTGLLPSHAQGADVVALGSWDNLVPYVWVTREKEGFNIVANGRWLAGACSGFDARWHRRHSRRRAARIDHEETRLLHSAR